MRWVLIEGLLFLAAIALLLYAIVAMTPLGTRWRQRRNRRRLERAVELTCPIHGPHSENELVLLDTGSRVCPDCYKETLHE